MADPINWQDVVEKIGRIDERTENLHRVVVGNGQPGLLQRVSDLEGTRNRALGFTAALSLFWAILVAIAKAVFWKGH